MKSQIIKEQTASPVPAPTALTTLAGSHWTILLETDELVLLGSPPADSAFLGPAAGRRVTPQTRAVPRGRRVETSRNVEADRESPPNCV